MTGSAFSPILLFERGTLSLMLIDIFLNIVLLLGTQEYAFTINETYPEVLDVMLGNKIGNKFTFASSLSDPLC